MPYKVQNRNGLYRLVSPRTGKIVKTKNNKAVDGGGHRSQAGAEAQARAIMASEKRKKKR